MMDSNAISFYSSLYACDLGRALVSASAKCADLGLIESLTVKARRSEVDCSGGQVSKIKATSRDGASQWRRKVLALSARAHASRVGFLKAGVELQSVMKYQRSNAIISAGISQ
jgi:hypothetical protein